MARRIKYICALSLIACIFLSACGTNDGKSSDESSSDNNIIYAPVDVTEDNVQSEADGGEPEDTSNTDVTEPDDTADATEAVDDSSETTEPTLDSEPVTPDDTNADGEQTEKTEPSGATPSVHAGVIMLGEDFLAGEHAAGSIVSKESEKMRLVVSYDCGINEDGGITVAVEVGLECYDINCGPRTNGGKIAVNGDVHTFSTDEIVHEEAGMIYIPFETYIKQLDASEKSCTIEASWFFNGVYAGVNLDTLTVGATLDWSTNN